MNTIKTAKIIFLYLAVVFTLAFLFTSCEIQRDCPGAGVKNGYSGYTGKAAQPIYGPKRRSF